MNDVTIVVVNGRPMATYIGDCKTLADVGKRVTAGTPDAGALWVYLSPAGDQLPASMPVRELPIGDTTAPDLYMTLPAGFAA